jgi:hypothetical protein
MLAYDRAAIAIRSGRESGFIAGIEIVVTDIAPADDRGGVVW